MLNLLDRPVLKMKEKVERTMMSHHTKIMNKRMVFYRSLKLIGTSSYRALGKRMNAPFTCSKYKDTEGM